MDLVASSSRARPQQPTASLPPRTAAPPSQSPFATSPWDHGSGAESISPGVMPQAPSGSWRASVGGGDLMSVLAESARRSEQGQFYPASPGTWRD
ncbi:MAG TPA: hypothetical protein VFL86_13330, partial [Burkholderiaceae bacterium]|nr:hypothetical protein [Burkholderiaceae bacterium]